jgi:hypothetical protein
VISSDDEKPRAETTLESAIRSASKKQRLVEKLACPAGSNENNHE